jgi:hypothetical protein
MAYSYYNYTGDGTTTQFPVAFGYIRREHVLASVAGSPVTFTWVNSSTIQMDVAPANGAVVRVYRQTPLTAPLVDFADGATLVAADLDTNAKQSIYTQQELSDSQEEGLANVIPNGDKGDITTSVGGTIWTIDTGAVTEAKIASGAVTEAKIGSGAVIEAKIASGAVTETKIANGAVTVAKLASGFAPTVSSINDGPLAGLRNRIINGNFDVWQRGTSFTGNEYGADRWVHARLGTTHTATRQAFTLGQTAVPNEPTYFCRTVVSSVTGSANYSILLQRIEDVRSFAGQQVTLSFWAKADAIKNISTELTQVFGSGGSPSATVEAIGVSKVSIGTSWQKVTVTATLPSISGKTLGTNNDHFLNVGIWFDGGSSFDARNGNLGHQSGTFDIAQVQIEPGSAATPFERRPIGLELELCRRYFKTVTLNGGAFSGPNQCFITPEGLNTFRATPSIAVDQYGFQFFNGTAWTTQTTGATFSMQSAFYGNVTLRVDGLVGNGTLNGTTTSAGLAATLSAEL